MLLHLGGRDHRQLHVDVADHGVGERAHLHEFLGLRLIQLRQHHPQLDLQSQPASRMPRPTSAVTHVLVESFIRRAKRIIPLSKQPAEADCEQLLWVGAAAAEPPELRSKANARSSRPSED